MCLAEHTGHCHVLLATFEKVSAQLGLSFLPVRCWSLEKPCELGMGLLGCGSFGAASEILGISPKSLILSTLVGGIWSHLHLPHPNKSPALWCDIPYLPGTRMLGARRKR